MNEQVSRSFYRSILVPNRDNAAVWLNALWLLTGIFFLGWSSASVLLAYFLETIIIGIIHIVKMIAVLKWGKAQRREARSDPGNGALNTWVAIPFFIFHYFFFIFVQSVFLFSFMERRDADISSAFNVFHNYGVILGRADVQQAVLAIVLMNVVLAVKNFFLPQKYHQYTISLLFFQPYLRIFIQQFTVLLGGFFILLGGTVAAAIILIVLRLAVDLFLLAASKSMTVRDRLKNKLAEKQTGDDRRKTKEMFDAFLDN